MKQNLQINAIKSFEYAFRLLEEKMNIGVQSLKARELILKQFEEHNSTNKISPLLNQIDGIESDDRLMAMQFIPAVVLLSFCIELALKVRIRQVEKSDVQGHDLAKLFERLESKEKREIKQSVINEQKISLEEFDAILVKNANGFVNWRYFYEKENSSNIEFLKTLLRFVKSKITNF